MLKPRRYFLGSRPPLVRLAPAISVLTLCALIPGGSVASALDVRSGAAGLPANNGPLATTTTVNLFPGQVVVGQQFRITADVTTTFGIPSGWVTFTLDGAALPGCQHVILAGPLAQCLAALSTVGGHAIEAHFNPADSTAHGDSTGMATITVGRATTLLVVLPATTPLSGRPFTPTVLVVPVAPASGRPTGSVTVTDDMGGGSCTMTLPMTACALPGTAAGVHVLHARYQGDDNFAGAQSPGTTQWVLAGPAHNGTVPAATKPVSATPGKKVETRAPAAKPSVVQPRVLKPATPAAPAPAAPAGPPHPVAGGPADTDQASIDELQPCGAVTPRSNC